MDDKRIDPSEVRVHLVARQLVYWARSASYLETGWGIKWFPEYWLIFGNKNSFSVDRANAKAICILLLQNIMSNEGLHKFYSGAIIFAMEGLTLEEQHRVKDILETYYGL